MKKNRAKLKEDVARINRRFNAGLFIEWAYGQPRIVDETESRNISPRLPVPQLILWLDGYYTGLDRAQDLKQMPFTNVEGK